jgi:hypothetical protein
MEHEQPTLIDKLLTTFRRMQSVQRDYYATLNDKTERLRLDMAKVEDKLIAELQEKKDVNGIVAFYNADKAHVMLRQEKLEDAIHAILRESNAKSIATQSGTTFLTTQTSVKVADWKVLLGHVIDTALRRIDSAQTGCEGGDVFDDISALTQALINDESFALLKHAASKDAVKAYIETEKKPVPGVDLSTRLQVSVRRK